MRDWTYRLMMAIGLAAAAPGTILAQAHAVGPMIIEIDHVRSRHESLRAMITTASEQSVTFRRMVDTINASDGIVYIEVGVCQYGVRACLVRVGSAGQRRYIFVKVDIGRTDRKTMASIGHELRHAVEVLSNPGVNDLTSLYFLYKFKLDRGSFSFTSFETTAAIEAGNAVADEIGRYRRLNKLGVQPRHR
jgi:hypothetical protein